MVRRPCHNTVRQRPAVRHPRKPTALWGSPPRSRPVFFPSLRAPDRLRRRCRRRKECIHGHFALLSSRTECNAVRDLVLGMPAVGWQDPSLRYAAFRMTKPLRLVRQTATAFIRIMRKCPDFLSRKARSVIASEAWQSLARHCQRAGLWFQEIASLRSQ